VAVPASGLKPPAAAKAYPLVGNPDVPGTIHFPVSSNPDMAAAHPVPEPANPEITWCRGITDNFLIGGRWRNHYHSIGVIASRSRQRMRGWMWWWRSVDNGPGGCYDATCQPGRDGSNRYKGTELKQSE